MISHEGKKIRHPWALILRLCAVGFFVNCQPSEPFLTRFLMEDKGLTEDQLDNLVWPTDTFASLVLLLPCGLLAEFWSYRGTVLVGLLCRQATRLLLLFGDGAATMQLMQVAYAVATDVESVAYFALPYLVLADRPEHFALATAAVRGACHLGNALGSGLGQCLVTYGGYPLRTLFFLSWAFTTCGVLAFPLLPAGRSGWQGTESSMMETGEEAQYDDESNGNSMTDLPTGSRGSGDGADGGDIAEIYPAESRARHSPGAVLQQLGELYRSAGRELDEHVAAQRELLVRQRTGVAGEAIALTGRSVACGVSSGDGSTADCGPTPTFPPPCLLPPSPPSCGGSCYAAVMSSLRSRLGTWTACLVLGTATNQIFSNYYQNVLYASDRNAPGGLVEFLMGVASAAASGFAALSHAETAPFDEDDQGEEKDVAPVAGAKKEQPTLVVWNTENAEDKHRLQGGTWLFRHHRFILLSTSAVWALLVALLVGAIGPWPPQLALACTLCILIDAIYSFQLAAAAVLIATDVSALQSSDSSSAYGGGNTSTGGDGRSSYYFLDERSSNDDRRSSLGSTAVPSYALIFAMSNLWGFAVAGITQWLCAAAASEEDDTEQGLSTRGYFVVAAVQEAFIIPLVLLPHLIFCRATSAAADSSETVSRSVATSATLFPESLSLNTGDVQLAKRCLT